ncbi:MAG: multidrug effflux transporter [Actinotalea sp.]|nr:multidrug effflux transporter [Actinotalea sp.]
MATARPAEARDPGPTAGFVLLVGLLTLLPAMTIDMYLPSLPEVADDLRSTEAAAQFTVTGMLIGAAAGQLVVGPFSDRVGRRLPVLIGVSVHAVISVLCAVSGTMLQLSTLRVLQGLGSAAATVVAMAVIRDRYAGAEAARLMSRLMLVIAVAPLLAPSIGSVLADRWGWRSVFLVLAVLAVVLVAVVAKFLPETLSPERRSRHGFVTSLRGYGDLLRDRRFLALATLPGLSVAVVISYVSGSPFVLQDEYGLSTHQFSLVFAIIGTSIVAGSQVNASLVRRVGPLRLLRTGLPASVLMAGGLVVVAATGAGGIVGLVVALWLTCGMLGFCISNAAALAMTRHGERAGTAAATIGFLQSGLAGSISSLVGVLGGSALAMTGVMLGSLVVGLLVLALATPAYRRDGWLAFQAPAD